MERNIFTVVTFNAQSLNSAFNLWIEEYCHFQSRWRFSGN